MMALNRACLCLLACQLAIAASLTAADEAPADAQSLHWETDYATAWRQARDEKKMLLLFFVEPKTTPTRKMVEDAFTKDADLTKQLGGYVLAKLPVDARMEIDGKPTTLLKHASLAEMHGREGLAIIDLASEGEDFYGYVVSAFPFMQGKYYRLKRDHLGPILDLPEGTITQRTMIWAVRMHPEKPASTRGTRSKTLLSEAHSQSRYQADIGVQGHHRWDFRFARILRLLGGRRTPVEVVAESWPNETMIDSCIDCVDSWRQSPGHWSAVKSYQTVYGYDIQRGHNGIWYGTGIFAN